MKKEYNSNSERKYAAPEAPRIVEPEPMTPKIPKWIKHSIIYLTFPYLLLNSGSFFLANYFRSGEMSKSEIEERIDHVDQGGLKKFVMDDLTKPGRELAYLIHGDGEKQK